MCVFYMIAMRVFHLQDCVLPTVSLYLLPDIYVVLYVSTAPAQSLSPDHRGLRLSYHTKS